MNNKGFTLIELIAVIALLAIIALLTTPNIIKMSDRNDADYYNKTIDSIISAAEVYVSDNKYNLVFDDNQYCKPTDTKVISTFISLKDLIDSKDINGEVKNHCTDKIVNFNEVKVKISLNCGNKNFSYELLFVFTPHAPSPVR